MGSARPAKQHSLRRAVLGAFALVTAIGVPDRTLAQAYPAGPVRMIVPFPSGGPLDFVSRLLAERLTAGLKQPFVVDNRPGAAGNIGTEAVAKAAPNGQTLLVVIDTPLTVNRGSTRSCHLIRRTISFRSQSRLASIKCWWSILRFRSARFGNSSISQNANA